MSNARLEANRGQGTKGGQFGFARDAADDATADGRAGALDAAQVPETWEQFSEKTSPVVGAVFNVKYDSLDEANAVYAAAEAEWEGFDVDEDFKQLAIAASLEAEAWGADCATYPEGPGRDMIERQLGWVASEVALRSGGSQTADIMASEWGYSGAVVNGGDDEVKELVAKYHPAKAYACTPTYDRVSLQVRNERDELVSVRGQMRDRAGLPSDSPRRVTTDGGMEFFATPDRVEEFEYVEHYTSNDPQPYTR